MCIRDRSPPLAWSCAPHRAEALRLPCAETARGHAPLAAGSARPGRRRGLLVAAGSGSPALVAAAFQVGAR
eukprot:14886063-Alexandrium_andersonii.AAC.1